MTNYQSEDMHPIQAGSRPLKITLGIVLGVMVLEVIGGLLSNSLALLGDAGHMLVDALALGLSLFAMTLARRPATLSRTYGYHRAEIIAALANGATLVVLSLLIFYEAYQRFLTPPQIRTELMLIVAAIGLVANLSGVALLRRSSHTSLNIKAAFWHVIGDTVSSVGVIAAAAVISITGWYVADSIMAAVIGAIILWGAVQVVRESADILLEAVPRHIRINEVVEAINKVPGVNEVHDIHVWTITSGIYALSAHLIIQDQTVSQSTDIVDAVNRDLASHFNITHTTFQLECGRCETCPSGFICNIRRHGEAR